MADVDDGKDDEKKNSRRNRREQLTIVEDYPTKNGKHLILKPFNPQIVSFDVLKNHMMLWVY